MSPDGPALAILALAALAGAVGGALRQLVHLLALGLAAPVAWFLAPVLRGPFGRVVGEARLARPLAAFAALAIAFGVLSIAGHLLLSLSRFRKAERSPLDRGLGALLGGAQAALVLWAILSLLVLWGRPVGPRGGLRVDPAKGDLAGFVRDHNLLDLLAPGEKVELEKKIETVRDVIEGGGKDRTREAPPAAKKRGGEVRKKAGETRKR